MWLFVILDVLTIERAMTKFGENKSRTVVFLSLTVVILAAGILYGYKAYARSRPIAVAARALSASNNTQGVSGTGTLEITKNEDNGATGEATLQLKANPVEKSSELRIQINTLKYQTADLSVLKPSGTVLAVGGSQFFYIDSASETINQTFSALKKTLGPEIGAQLIPVQNDLNTIEKQVTSIWVEAPKEGSGGGESCALDDDLLKVASESGAVRLANDHGYEVNQGVEQRHLSFNVDGTKLPEQYACVSELKGVSDIWIGKVSGRVEKITLPISMKENKIEAKLTLNLAYGETVSLAKPEQSMSWEDYRSRAKKTYDTLPTREVLSKSLTGASSLAQ